MSLRSQLHSLSHSRTSQKTIFKKVLEVHLRVGKLRVLSIDQLKFSYEILSKGTALEGSLLDIEETPGYARCTNSQHAEKLETDDLSFYFSLPQMTYPQCGTKLILEGGDECLITRVPQLYSADE